MVDVDSMNLRDSWGVVSGLEFSIQELYQGVSLEPTRVAERRKKQESAGRKEM